MPAPAPRFAPGNRSKSWPLVVLVLLNALPLVGVLYRQWQSFDLIFLYWLENLVVGAFVLARMLVRSYAHPVDLFMPLLIAPFFVLHCGMFCYVHGLFVVSLFHPGGAPGGLLTVLREMLSAPMLLAALGGLTLVQAFDWLQEVRERGLGNSSIRTLMFQPYRRIIVLHLVLIGSAFLLSTLQEPVAGLLLLVAVKISADCLNRRRSLALEDDSEAAGAPSELTDAQLEALDAQFAEPKVVVNGRTRRFASFAELRDSSEYRLVHSLTRMLGVGHQLELVEAYLDRRIEAERAQAADQISANSNRQIESKS